MDEVTLVGAGLIGAGIAVLGLALFAAVRRTRRSRVRSRQPGRRPAPPARPAPPRPALARPAAVAPARVRPGNDDPPRRPRPPHPAARINGPRPPVAARALDGETLQLGPVPAWRLPIRPRNDGPVHGLARPDESPALRPGPPPTGSGAPTGAPDSISDRAAPADPEADRMDGARPLPPPPKGELVSRAGPFGWFSQGR